VIFDYFNNISFGQPLFFLLFALLPVLIFWKFGKGKKQQASLPLSSTSGLSNSRSWKNISAQLHHHRACATTNKV
jgi:hypothetical protein